MLSNGEIDVRARDYRALTLAQQQAFKLEVIRRAHAERDAVMRSVFRGLWSALAHAGLVQTGAAAIRNLWTAFRKRRECNIAINELFAFDDHMLKDMGISRSEIIAVVRAEHSSRLPPAMTPKNGRDRLTACVSQSSARAQRVSISPT